MVFRAVSVVIGHAVQYGPNCPINSPTPLANSPDWLKAAPMRENLLASWRQPGQKQDPCPSLLNHNAKYMQLLPPYCDFANGVQPKMGQLRPFQHLCCPSRPFLR